MTYLPEPKVHANTRWAYAECPGLGTDDLMRAPYSPARGLVRVPQRLACGRHPVRSTEAIGTMMARSVAAKCAQENYALRVELGERAYALLMGRAERRTPKAKAVSRKTVVADIVSRSNGSAPVVLSDHEMMKALGIKSVGATVGYLE